MDDYGLGLGGFSKPSDRDPTDPIEGEVRQAWERLVGCFRWARLEGREEKCNPVAVSEAETSDESIGNGTAIYLTVGLSNELRIR